MYSCTCRYISFESYIDAATACNSGKSTPAHFDASLPTLATTAAATAILEVRARALVRAARAVLPLRNRMTLAPPSASGGPALARCGR